MMTIEKTINGLVLSDIVKNQYIHRLYQGYTQKEAKRLFKQFIKDGVK